MRHRGRSSLLVVVAVVAGACAADRRVDDTGVDPEVARVRRHLAAVEAELRAADVSHLTAAQRAARDANLDRLHRYREAGVFPHNHGVAVRAPFFVDAHGTRCAMAHLIEQAGSGQLVAAVAAARNHAYVPELAGDPELAAWLDRNGLSLDEAARIQPTYDPCQYDPCSRQIDGAFAAASAGVALADGIAIGLNVSDNAGTATGVIGLVAGGASIALGVHGLSESGRVATQALGFADMAVGAVTLGLSVWRLWPSGNDDPGPTAGWSVAPMVGQASGVAVTGAF